MYNSYQLRNIFEYFIESHINKCNGKRLYLFVLMLFDVMFGIVFTYMWTIFGLFNQRQEWVC